MRVHYPKLRNIAHPISLGMFLLLPKDQAFIFLFAITAADIVPCGGPKKVSTYVIHSADYILFRSFEISKDIQSVQNTHV